MQELPNAPWNTGGDNDGGAPGMNREEYISFVKNQELMEEQERALEEQAEAEPPK